jgi:hypothetical protein
MKSRKTGRSEACVLGVWAEGLKDLKVTVWEESNRF